MKCWIEPTWNRAEPDGACGFKTAACAWRAAETPPRICDDGALCLLDDHGTTPRVHIRPPQGKERKTQIKSRAGRRLTSPNCVSLCHLGFSGVVFLSKMAFPRVGGCNRSEWRIKSFITHGVTRINVPLRAWFELRRKFHRVNNRPGDFTLVSSGWLRVNAPFALSVGRQVAADLSPGRDGRVLQHPAAWREIWERKGKRLLNRLRS